MVNLSKKDFSMELLWVMNNYDTWFTFAFFITGQKLLCYLATCIINIHGLCLVHSHQWKEKLKSVFILWEKHFKVMFPQPPWSDSSSFIWQKLVVLWLTLTLCQLPLYHLALDVVISLHVHDIACLIDF